MNINYTSLNAVQVSNKILEQLLYVTRRARTLGASPIRADIGECMITQAVPKKSEATSEAPRRIVGKLS
jgi:mevalonate kinase